MSISPTIRTILQADHLHKEYEERSSDSLDREGFSSALALFHEAAVRVPAYRDFLAKNKVDASRIKTLSDFQHVPIIDKNNYLRQYELDDLCWDGSLTGLSIISSSSGSTSKSFLWPRGVEQEIEGEAYIELIFKNFFSIDKHTTLYINCFSMGTWVAGTYLLSSMERLSWKGCPIITVCPGIEKQIALQLFEELAPQFDQIVIGGYPPLIKDILDEGRNQGIEWNKHRIRFLFAAEGFSEQWRAHVHSLVGSEDSYATSINIYGSADATILAHETPLTNAIRQNLGNDPLNLEKLFGDSRLPTLAQYDPRLRYFETHGDQVIFSARAGLPLVRYSIGDNGGLRSFNEMQKLNQDLGYDWQNDKNLKPSPWPLPFVWVFGRKNLATNLYGVLIFPEYVKSGLEDQEIIPYLTGKFVMTTELDQNNDQYLQIGVELAENTEPPSHFQYTLTSKIVDALKRQSGEYNALHRSITERAIPNVELLPHGSAEFKVGSKHRWVKKN